MKILSIDSSMNGCSAGLYDSNFGIISEEILEISRGQAEYLMPMIDKVVKSGGGDYCDLDLIAVVKGPGAFTGIRIGLATAKALGLALEIPVVGVCTFETILETYLSLANKCEHDFYGVLLETKRDDFYFQMFDGKTLESYSDKMAASRQDILSLIVDKDCILIGDANKRFLQYNENNLSINFYDINMPSPLSIVKKAIKDYDNTITKYDCNPVYLRSPEIGVPKKLPRILNI